MIHEKSRFLRKEAALFALRAKRSELFYVRLMCAFKLYAPVFNPPGT